MGLERRAYTHNSLSGRDKPNCHTLSSITGLQSVLDGITHDDYLSLLLPDIIAGVEITRVKDSNGRVTNIAYDIGEMPYRTDTFDYSIENQITETRRLVDPIGKKIIITHNLTTNKSIVSELLNG